MNVTYPQNIQCLFHKVIETSGVPTMHEDDMFAIELSFVEAVNNAMIHGNKKSSEKTVKIEYSFCDGLLEIIITDQGNGFSFKKIPNPTEEHNLTKDSGRGVLLIEHYMDTVEYNDKGNQVRMAKRIKAVD